MTLTLEQILEKIETERSNDLVSHVFALNELTVTIKRERLVKFITYLRDEPSLHFTQLIDLCGVDYPERAERFEVVYHLLSLTHNLRIRLKITTDEHTSVPSITHIFNAANWFEREAFDLYGVAFEGHPD